MTNRRKLVALLGACFVVTAAGAQASPAGAAATAAVGDPADDFGLGADAMPADVRQVDVIWDGSVLQVSLAYERPPVDQRLAALIGDSANERTRDRCDPRYLPQIQLNADGERAVLSIPYVGGTLETLGLWDAASTRVTYAFDSPVLRAEFPADDPHDPFTCLSGNAGGDRFFGAFAGRVLWITPANALDALRAFLLRRFGEVFARSHKPWLRCPPVAIAPATDESAPTALCGYQFRVHGGYRVGSLSLFLAGGVLDELSRSKAALITKRLRRCPRLADLRLATTIAVDRELLASDLVGCSDNGASMIRDVHYQRTGPVGLHGTNRAGFEDEAMFRCARKRSGDRYAAHCRNRLGDQFVYRYRLIARAPEPRRPSPPVRAPSCDSNYSGACLDPNASDYDCAGGSGNGPLYTGPVRVIGNDHYGLDSDGDGLGCE